MPVAPAEINDSRSRPLFEHHSWKKDGPAYPIRLGLEEQLKPQRASRTTVRSTKPSRSQRCSPTRKSGLKVICVSSPSISKVMSPQLSITASKEGLRDSCVPRGRRGMNSCIHTSTSIPLRSAASLNDLSLMHDHLTFSVPSPKHEFRKGTPTDPIGEDHDALQSIPEFLLSLVQLPHARMYQKRGGNIKQFPLPSFHLYPACFDLNLNILTSLFSNYYLSSLLNFLACPLSSELIHSSQAFRGHAVPGGKSLQISSGQSCRPPNSPVLLGQAPSSKGYIASGSADSMTVSSSTPDVRFPGHPRSGPPLVGDVFQGPWLPDSWSSSFGLHGLLDMWEHSFRILDLILSSWVCLT